MSDLGINNNLTHKYDLNKVKETVTEFKTSFLSKMFNIVFENVSFDPLAPKDSKSNIFKSLLVDEYSKAVSNNTSFPFDEQITQKLMQLQEVNND